MMAGTFMCLVCCGFSTLFAASDAAKRKTESKSVLEAQRMSKMKGRAAACQIASKCPQRAVSFCAREPHATRCCGASEVRNEPKTDPVRRSFDITSRRFLLPSGKGRRLLGPGAFRGLRWDIVILLGGGLALAGLIDRSGLAGWVGGFVGRADALPIGLIVLALAATIVYVGELASNTAMAAVFLPVAGAAALAVGAEPVAFLLPIALAASVGFMLPVATPPNAIVMDSPAVTREAMLRAGALLDVAGLAIAVALGLILAPLLL